MLYLYTGTDRQKARAALEAAVKKAAKKDSRVVRITDANAPEDLGAALGGRGMFGEARVVVLNGILGDDEMRAALLNALAFMRDSEEAFFVLEEKPDAATRKQIEKYADKSERYDSPAAKKGEGIFGIAHAFKRADKKALWVNYRRQLADNVAPEAIHGVLFWAAKDMFMKSAAGEAQNRAKKLVARLAEMPHEARRRGEDLEYALERFLLSIV